MCGIPALFRLPKRLRQAPRSSRSPPTTLLQLPGSSTFNSVGGNQYNITTYPTSHIYTTPQIRQSDRQAAQIPFNDAPIDLLSIHFTGRKTELALISKAFERPRNVPLRCALYGNQGVGKSQLTYEWARSTFDRGENSYILWISATTVEKLYQGFCRLLHLVNHPDRSNADQSARLTAARRWFEEVDAGNWLLVLDNVFPETLDFLRQHLPRQNGLGSILFTTRTKHVADALACRAGERHEVVEVPLLSVEEGVELFLGHFKDDEVDLSLSKVEEIVKAVGCLPLAISHVAAYMKQSGSTLDDVLKLYRGEYKIDVSRGTRISTGMVLRYRFYWAAYQLGKHAIGVRTQISRCDIYCPTTRP
jgi:hypothetical protein